MRVMIGVSVIAVVLAATGCQSTGRNGRARAPSGGSGEARPFVGSPSADGAAGNLTSTGSRPTVVRGFLAGQVLDRDNRRVPKAKIQVIDVDAPKAGAALVVISNRDGYFDIGGLDKGKHYRLVAEWQDGGKVLKGTTRVQANNSRLVIYLSDEETVREPTPPDKGDAKPPPAPPPGPEEKAKDGAPAASLERPLAPGAGVTTPLPGASATPSAAPLHDPSLIADSEGAKDGFRRAPPVSVPSAPGRESAPQKKRPPTLPPPPTSVDETPLPFSTAPPATPAPPPAAPPAPRPGPAARLPVPSCVRVGSLIDFALYDFDGNVWQYRQQQRGKLTLIDFWFSSCRPCVQSLPFLVRLQQWYGPHGLQVVGIAYEGGAPLQDRQYAVRRAFVSARTTRNYPVLFGGARCPVQGQFDVHQFPTLVLLDENGRELMRFSGHNEHKQYDLELRIREHLGLPRR